jgi:hypothetical protein
LKYHEIKSIRVQEEKEKRKKKKEMKKEGIRQPREASKIMNSPTVHSRTQIVG